MSTPTETTSLFASPTQSAGSGGGSSAGAATYYGAIALAVLVMLVLTVTSRILYTRRIRRNVSRDRMDLRRRGEEGGLPTYRETTSPHSLSYLSTPLSSLRTAGTAVPTSHPQYGAVTARPSRTYHPGDTSAPPAYVPPPPKYEEEGVLSDREAEVGGAGQEVDAGLVAGGSSEVPRSSEGGSSEGGARTGGIEDAGESFEGVTPSVEPAPTGDRRRD